MTTLYALMLPSEAQCSWLMVEAWLSRALCSVAGCKKEGNAPSLDSCPHEGCFLSRNGNNCNFEQRNCDSPMLDCFLRKTFQRFLKCQMVIKCSFFVHYQCNLWKRPLSYSFNQDIHPRVSVEPVKCYVMEMEIKLWKLVNKCQSGFNISDNIFHLEQLILGCAVINFNSQQNLVF